MNSKSHGFEIGEATSTGTGGTRRLGGLGSTLGRPTTGSGTGITTGAGTRMGGEGHGAASSTDGTGAGGTGGTGLGEGTSPAGCDDETSEYHSTNLGGSMERLISKSTQLGHEAIAVTRTLVDDYSWRMKPDCGHA